MSNANKVARYLTTIDSAQSYAINILVVKPMAVTATFFFFIHTLLRLNDEKLSFKTFIKAKTFPSLSISIIVFSAFLKLNFKIYNFMSCSCFVITLQPRCLLKYFKSLPLITLSVTNLLCCKIRDDAIVREYAICMADRLSWYSSNVLSIS